MTRISIILLSAVQLLFLLPQFAICQDDSTKKIDATIRYEFDFDKLRKASIDNETISLMFPSGIFSKNEIARMKTTSGVFHLPEDMTIASNGMQSSWTWETVDEKAALEALKKWYPGSEKKVNPKDSSIVKVHEKVVARFRKPNEADLSLIHI